MTDVADVKLLNQLIQETRCGYKLEQSGTVIGSSNTPRSHFLETDSGVFRSNRSHLTVLPSTDSDLSETENDPVETETVKYSAVEVQSGIESDFKYTRSCYKIIVPKRIDL